MALEIPLLAEKGEIASLVREKAQIEVRLTSAGGREFGFLLEDCADISDIIDEIGEVISKNSEKEHAAFAVKIKFSRKARRKAKDLNNFEQKLVQEYDNRHITLEHGRKMAEIIKLLKSKKVEQARRDAEEFYAFLEMGARLEIINDLLEKKKAQAERAKRSISAQLDDLEWVGEQAAPDMEKISRHEMRAKTGEMLVLARARLIRQMQAMPIIELLKKAKEEELEKLGFPLISAHEMDSLAAFLRKSGLETKSAGQVCEMAGLGEQKLRHLGIDLAGFRQEIAGRTAFLSEIMALQPSHFIENISPGSPALAYLSAQSEEAKNAADKLAELERTAEQDTTEWGRWKRIEEKKARLSGATKSGLENSLKEMEGLESVLNGRAGAAQQSGEEKGKGILDSVLGFLKRK